MKSLSPAVPAKWGLYDPTWAIFPTRSSVVAGQSPMIERLSSAHFHRLIIRSQHRFLNRA